MFDLTHFNLQHFIISIVVLVCSIALHEFGHAFSADYLGDPTPRRQGRVTLWPDKHFDPIGFSMMVLSSIAGFGIGWGKPVMYDPRYFKNPIRDEMITKACGPLMNLILALAFGIPLRFAMQHGYWAETSLWYLFFFQFVIINLALMFFNLIPVGPLDGCKILTAFMPRNMANQYDRFMDQYGIILLMILIITGGSGYIIMPAVIQSLGLILGQHYLLG